MTQIPILNGVYVDVNADFRTSYPRNLIPVPKEQGISKGYLKQAQGLTKLGTGPGVDRGGINWNGVCYRVMDTTLLSVDENGIITALGQVGSDGLMVTFDYSFDRLAVCSAKKLYYWSPSLGLVQVTDPNLGSVINFIWIDGYFLFTDGSTLGVTTLNDPMSVNPLAYGSSEADPDPILCIIKIRNEAAVMNRYTIEFMQDTAAGLYPFTRVDGAEVMRGCIGTKCAVAFVQDSIAFMGSARKEPPAIWTALNGISTKISTLEIDEILISYTEAQLALCMLERRVERNSEWLYVHLPDQTLVYDYNSTLTVGEPVWYVLDSGIGPTKQAWRMRNLVWAYNKWIFGDVISSNIGTFTDSNSYAYGNETSWQCETIIIYNQTNGAIFHELELIALTGNIDNTKEPTVWMSYSTDGLTWSREKPRSVGKIGNRYKRLNWLHCGNMKMFRIQRFRGTSSAHIALAALEARIEPLND